MKSSSASTWLRIAAGVLVILGAYASPVRALETDILFGDPVKPNVLILFDNSGSMNNAPTYQSEITYSGTYVPTTVYHRCQTYSSSCTCSKTQIAWVVATGSCGFQDTNDNGIDDRTVYKKLGNELNYESTAGATNKLTAAKQVIDSLLQQPDVVDVRFGLMVYTNTTLPSDYSNYTQVDNWHKDTTVLKSTIKDNNQAALIPIVNAISANGGTPSANRLIQAGDYFAGTLSGFSSPIQYTCQRNYVILITDGKPEVEGDTLNAEQIGQFDHLENWLHAKLGSDIDPDNDNNETVPGYDPVTSTEYINGGSGYLDDVAWVLNHQDLRPSMDGLQNVTVFTIGFDVAHPLLQHTADTGGGRYFTASTADQLADALRRAINLIITDAQSFVAPVVPVNALKRTQSGDRLYIALFQPLQSSNFWAGNIKKYGISSTGDLVSPDGSPATGADGSINQTASSYFDGLPSGGAVTKGGVGELLANRSNPRNIYTYLGNADLTSSTNAFTTTNTGITNTTLAVPDTTTHDNVIRYIRGEDVYDDDEDGNTTEKRDWVLGDFIHSTPLVANYSTTDRVILAGANDGQLHAFDDANGQELWSFVPPGILPRLKELIPGATITHPFLVDGSPKLLTTDSGQMIVVFGLRRGGRYYYAIDVTSKTAPRYLWGVSDSTSGMSELGQSWSDPALGKIGTAASFNYAALIGAGYDTYFDDPTKTAANSATPSGRGVFALNVLTGAVLQALRPSAMTFSVPSDISAIDTNQDGTLDLAYFGDTGGSLWRWDLPTTLTKAFTAPTGHRIFAEPDLSINQGFLDVAFGTGDLASPLYTGVEDRLYLFRDDDLTGGYTETDLVDVTSNVAQEGSTSEKTAIRSQLASKRGWYIRLTRSGEKALSSPLIFFDIFFTTFLPTTAICSGGGDASLYKLGFDDGGATTDLDASGALTAADRLLHIGSSIPTEVTATIRDTNAVGYVGVGGAIPRVNLPGPPLNVIPIYWREAY